MNESQEPKYCITPDGKIANRKTGRIIPDDEPVFILRARDKHAIYAMAYYSARCEIEGHKDIVDSRIDDFRDFARQHPDRMQEPGQFHGE